MSAAHTALPEHWVPLDLLGCNASFGRAARAYAEDYARAALALAASPPLAAPAVPLTYGQIDAMAGKEGDFDIRSRCWSFNGDPEWHYNLTNFVRAIERAHGIGLAPTPAKQGEGA